MLMDLKDIFSKVMSSHSLFVLFVFLQTEVCESTAGVSFFVWEAKMHVCLGGNVISLKLC